MGVGVMGFDTTASRNLSNMIAALRMRMAPSPHAVPVNTDVYFLQIIGLYAGVPDDPETESSATSRVDLSVSSNHVINSPHAPMTQRRATFQASLFSAFQPSVERILPHPVRRESRLYRTALPFVILQLQCRTIGGVPDAHDILVDFSDPRHPGVFDPNYGWLEPEQGFCILSLEQILTVLWEHYTRVRSTTPGMQGSRHIAGDDNTIFWRAVQIFQQSTTSQAADAKPARRK